MGQEKEMVLGEVVQEVGHVMSENRKTQNKEERIIKRNVEN
jgi:hypothetical protein